MNSRDNFEDVVSVITDQVCKQRNADAMRGVFSPIAIIGMQITSGLTRDQVRARVREAACNTSFDVLNGLLNNGHRGHHDHRQSE